MECKYGLKKNRNRKWIAIIIAVVLIVLTSAVIIKLSNGKKEVKGIETIDEAWGLGKVVTESVSNNRDYNWYVDQYDTGQYAAYNNIPAVCEMVLKWLDRNSQLTAEEISNQMRLGQTKMGEIMKKNIINYDDVFELETIEKPKDSESEEDIISSVNEKIKQKLKAGSICMVPCNMISITFNTDRNQRCGKFVSGGNYKWLILKGYKVVDGKLYFQAYDPESGGVKYGDGTPIGKDRYFLAKEVAKSALGGVFYVKGN